MLFCCLMVVLDFLRCKLDRDGGKEVEIFMLVDREVLFVIVVLYLGFWRVGFVVLFVFLCFLW